jgi:uncharacterized protein YceK
MKSVRVLAFSGLAMLSGLSLSGCGTIWNFDIGADAGGLRRETRIYGGVQVDAEAVGKVVEPWNSGWGRVIAGLFIFDVPLSLAGDTLTLPVTIPMALLRKPEPETEPDRNPQGETSFHRTEK